MKQAFDGIFEGMKVLITGHTGFKGSWLALWLQELGACPIGYSLPPPTDPNHFTLSRIDEGMVDICGDIRNYRTLLQTIQEHQPEVIFHLAAQPLVLASFENPKETFDVNVGGTVNVLEAIKHSPSVRAAVLITSDKCYENREWAWGYREMDALGGDDPYSASKCMAEFAIASYRKSFFGKDACAIASARAGNVIGGGDFSDFRIVPDCMKALMAGTTVTVRNPSSVRPWLNVLEPLSGYLLLAANLLKKGRPFAQAWNFGPMEQRGIDVKTLVEKAIHYWGDGEWACTGSAQAKAEMGLLRLNWDKAAHHLDWKPVYSWEQAIQHTVEWYKDYHLSKTTHPELDLRQTSLALIHHYATQEQQRMELCSISPPR